MPNEPRRPPEETPLRTPPTIRKPTDADRAGWATLFRTYREHEHLRPDESVVDRVWDWIHDDTSAFDAFVAVGDSGVIGLLHYRRFPRPLSGTTGLYIDNVMTAASWRRQGVAHTLINTVVQEAARQGDHLVRWMAAADNTTAQSLYDRMTPRAPWVVYDIDPRTGDGDSRQSATR